MHRQDDTGFDCFWIQLSIQMNLHISGDRNWNRHTGECCQKCGNSSTNAVVVGCEPGRYTTTRVWLLPPEVVRQHIYSNFVVFCLSSNLDKATPRLATMAMQPWLSLAFVWRRLSSIGLAVSSTSTPRPRRRLMVVQSESSCQVSVRVSTCSFSPCMSCLTSSTLLLTDRMFRHPKRVKRLR